MAHETSADDPLQRNARWFRHFAETCRERSPLYHQLALGIAGNDALLALARSPTNQPPHVLLAAVHYLLLGGAEHPLRDFYPSVAGRAAAGPAAAFPVFGGFCREFRASIQQLVAERIVQTNEVNRCGYLYLALGLVARLAPGRPLALVEVGSSAGLNLLLDRFAYRFSGRPPVGDRASEVRIECELRGPIAPLVPDALPEVVLRRGIDLNPIDLDDEDAVLWLRAMVWPDQPARAEQLTRAVDLARTERPELIRGSGLDHLAAAIETAPPDAVVCAFHTHTVHTWTEEDRASLASQLDRLTAGRWLVRVAAEWLGTPTPRLELTQWRDGRPQTELLADCDDHGRWVEWLAE